MDIVFIGTAGFAVPSLQALHEAGHRLLLVVSQPDKPGHRMRLTPPAVKIAAQELGLEVFQPERIRLPEAVERLRELKPELLALAAYGQIIPRSVLELAPRGVVNVHGSLLPRWRGAAPVSRALLAGDAETGVTIVQMDEQLDHGPTLARRSTPIAPREEAPELTGRLAEMGAALLVEVLADLDAHPPVEQDHAAATLAPRLRKEEGRVDWSRPAAEIDRQVRALKPWPGTIATLRGREVKLLRGRPVAGSGPPGEVLAAGRDGLTVATGAGAYLVEELQVPGRRPMAAGQLR
jgi:methionyl-tRNA formyltransferase